MRPEDSLQGETYSLVEDSLQGETYSLMENSLQRVRPILS
jgi:hypothetical protein